MKVIKSGGYDMIKTKNSRIACFLLSSLFCLSITGCGNQPIKVEDYGYNTESKADSENENDSVYSTSKSLSSMLGGTDLSYNNTFNLGDKQISIDVDYNLNETESLSEYMLEAVHEDQFNEQNIVNNFFGDTAIPFNKDATLNVENGDSIYAIMASQMITFNNTNSGNDVASWGSSGSAWMDEGTYYIHTYNGTYRNTDYQLLISYSHSTNELNVVLFPKNVGDLVGDQSYEYMDFSDHTGRYYSYYKNQMKSYPINEVMSDRPNKCTLSDDQVIDTASSIIKEKIGIDYPKEALSMHSNLTGLVNDYSGEPQKCEILYFPESALSSENFEGAIRNGYALSVLGSLDKLNVLTNTTNTSNSVSMYNNGLVCIDDQGIVALYISAKYSFKEKTVENVKVLSFNDALDSFVKEAPNKLDLSKEKRVDNNVKFNYIQLVYYPIPKDESSNEYRLVPAWSLDTLNSSKEPIARVLINAEDGSYITTLFKPVDEQ